MKEIIGAICAKRCEIASVIFWPFFLIMGVTRIKRVNFIVATVSYLLIMFLLLFSLGWKKIDDLVAVYFVFYGLLQPDLFSWFPKLVTDVVSGKQSNKLLYMTMALLPAFIFGYLAMINQVDLSKFFIVYFFIGSFFLDDYFFKKFIDKNI